MTISRQTLINRSTRYAVLAALALLIGACDGGEQPEPSTSATGSVQVDSVGQVPAGEAPVPLSESEIESLPSLGGSGPQSGGDLTSPELDASCWVTLNWCRNPSTGRATCTATSGCSAPASICASLIPQYCGHISFSGVSCSRGSSTSSWTCSSF